MRRSGYRRALPEVDQLLQQAGKTLDEDRRRELYVQPQKIIVEDPPIAYINVDPLWTIYHSGCANAR